MARVIVVTSGKGGVGKTTITAGLGMALAGAGYHVCLVDADLGLKNLDVILGVEARVIYDMLDVIEGRCALEKALVKDKKYQSLALLPSCKGLDVQTIDFSYLQKIISELKQRFDIILIDSPAGIERGFFNAIKSATEALLVVNLDIASLRDADKVIGLLIANGINDVKLIINKMTPQDVASGNTLSVETALNLLSIPLLGIIYEDEQLQQQSNRQQASALSARSNAGRCLQNIAKRLKGEDVPLAKYRKKGILARILG